MLALRAVAPENVLGLCQRRDLVYPIEHRLIGGLRITDPLGWKYCRREILHRTKLPTLTMNPPSSRLPQCSSIPTRRHGMAEQKYWRNSQCVICRFTCTSTARGIN